MLLRWILRCCVIVGVALVPSCITLFWVTFTPPRRVPAPLTEKLGNAWEQAEHAFAQRVAERFPLGSSEADMATELRREGFSREDWGFSTEDEHEAVRREDDAICHRAAYVYWHADAERRLTAIHGLYRNEGYL